MEQSKSAALPPVPVVVMELVKLFQTVGPVYNLGMAPVPLPFTEIAAAAPWSTSDEREAVRAMSRAYLEGHTIGEDPFGIAPWEG